MAEDQEVKMTVFGHPVAIKGLSMFVVLVLAAALGVIIYFVVTGNETQHARQSDMQTREHQDLVEGLREIHQTSEKIGELVNEQNYMLLSDEKERKSMKEHLRRPSSLSKKLKGESE